MEESKEAELEVAKGVFEKKGLFRGKTRSNWVRK